MKTTRKADHKVMVPAPPRRWHCLSHNATSAGHGCAALLAPPTLPVLPKILPAPHTLPLEQSLATLLMVKSQKRPWPFGTHFCVLHSLVPSPPFAHPSPIARPSNFQALHQSKGHMFFPALSSHFFADRWSNEAHEIYLSSRHSCRHSLLKQREVASGIQRQSLKGHYITCTIAATKLSHLYQKEATLSKHQ